MYVTQNFHSVSQHFCAFSENLSVALLVQRLSSMKGVGSVMFSGLRALCRSISVRFHSFQPSVLKACSSAQKSARICKKEARFEQTTKKRRFVFDLGRAWASMSVVRETSPGTIFGTIYKLRNGTTWAQAWTNHVWDYIWPRCKAAALNEDYGDLQPQLTAKSDNFPPMQATAALFSFPSETHWFSLSKSLLRGRILSRIVAALWGIDSFVMIITN